MPRSSETEIAVGVAKPSQSSNTMKNTVMMTTADGIDCPSTFDQRFRPVAAGLIGYGT